MTRSCSHPKAYRQAYTARGSAWLPLQMRFTRAQSGSFRYHSHANLQAVTGAGMSTNCKYGQSDDVPQPMKPALHRGIPA